MENLPELNINGIQINQKICEKKDFEFILEMTSQLFPYVLEFHKTIDYDMFYNRLNIDYKERILLFYKTERIGFYQISKMDKKLIVKGLFIKKEYQKQGIGIYMMNYFESIAKKSRLEKIELLVWENNTPAIEFYKKLNYGIISTENHKHTMIKKITK